MQELLNDQTKNPADTENSCSPYDAAVRETARRTYYISPNETLLQEQAALLHPVGASEIDKIAQDYKTSLTASFVRDFILNLRALAIRHHPRLSTVSELEAQRAALCCDSVLSLDFGVLPIAAWLDLRGDSEAKARNAHAGAPFWNRLDFEYDYSTDPFAACDTCGGEQLATVALQALQERCPAWHGFLAASIPAALDKLALLEAIGNYLCPITNGYWRGCWQLVGAPNSGKSTVIKFLKRLVLGEAAAAVATIDPCRLSDKFAFAAFAAGANRVLCDDLRHATIVDTDRFNALTSGGILSAEEKNKAAVTVQRSVACIFAGNTFLRSVDPSGAFETRVHTCNFYRGGGANSLTLDSDLWDERHAFCSLCWHLLSYKYRSKQSWTSPQAELFTDAQATANPLAEYIRTHIAIDPFSDVVVTSKDILQDFCRWCIAVGYDYTDYAKVATSGTAQQYVGNHRTFFPELTRLLLACDAKPARQGTARGFTGIHLLAHKDTQE